MGDALRRQEGISGLETEILHADAETELSFQNMEDFILALVQVERRGIAIRGEVFENGYPIRPVRVADPDYDGGVQEPEVVRTATGAFGELARLHNRGSFGKVNSAPARGILIPEPAHKAGAKPVKVAQPSRSVKTTPEPILARLPACWDLPEIAGNTPPNYPPRLAQAILSPTASVAPFAEAVVAVDGA